MADVDHVRHIIVRQSKIRPYPPRTGREQLDGAVLALAPANRQRLVGGWEVHPAHREEMLCLHVQPGPRCGQDLDSGRAVEHVGHQSRTRQQVLKVVHDEKHPLPAEGLQQLLPGLKGCGVSGAGVAAEPHRLGHRGHDGLRRPQRRQGDEKDAVLKVLQLRGCRLQRQAGLAAATRPHQRQQPAIWIPQALADLGQDRLSPYEGGGLGGQVVPGQGSSGSLPAHSAGPNLLIEGRRLLGGCESQFLLEDARALLVLAQRGRPLAGLVVQLHQGAVGRLVQRVERQPAPGVRDGRLDLTLGTVSTHELLEGRCQILAQPFGLEELPLVEGWAVGQGEPRHKVPPIELDGLGERDQAVGADGVLGMAVFPPVAQPAAEPLHVHPQAKAGVQADGFPVREQPLCAQRLPEHRQVAAQVGPGATGFELGPEQGNE